MEEAMFDQNLANRVLVIANRKFPDPFVNKNELRESLGTTKGQDPDVLLAVEALEKQGQLRLQTPVRLGLGKLQDFVGLEITTVGRDIAQKFPPDTDTGSGFLDPAKKLG
jgi:hypothetical protein